MSASSRRVLRLTGASVRMVLVLTVVLGVAYPLAITGVAQVAFPGRADGSVVDRDGHVVGSSLVGQSFDREPRYFQSRPSASGYDPLASGASNLGPESPALLRQVERRRTAVARLDGTDPADVPPDAVTASGSGLDPHISPEYAAQQVARVAQVRGLDPSEVRRLVAEHTAGRVLGFLGEPGVDVLMLNLALDALHEQQARAAD